MDSDLELLAAWVDGDKAAGNQLMRRYLGEMSCFFRNKVSNEADAAELVSQTFLGCTQSKQGFRGDAQFRRFLYGIAENVLRKYLRKKHKVQREELDFAQVCLADLDPASVSSIAMHRREAQALVEALRQIPVGDQVVLELMYFRGLTGPQVSEVLGIPEPTVRGRVHRAKQRLRERVSALLAQGAEVPSSEVALDDLESWAHQVRDQEGWP